MMAFTDEQRGLIKDALDSYMAAVAQGVLSAQDEIEVTRIANQIMALVTSPKDQPKPINNQILDHLADASFPIEEDHHGQIVIYTNLRMVRDENAPSGVSAVEMTDEDYEEAS